VSDPKGREPRGTEGPAGSRRLRRRRRRCEGVGRPEQRGGRPTGRERSSRLQPDV